MPLVRLIGLEWATVPTLGIGSTSTLLGEKYAALATGVAKEFWTYSKSAGNVKAGIYDTVTGTPTNLLDGDQTGILTSADQWNTTILTGDISIVASTVYALFSNSDTANTRAYESGSSAMYYKNYAYASGLEDPLTGISGGGFYMGYQVWGYIPPAIIDVDGDENVPVDGTNVVVTCTNAESSKGSGKLEISDNSTYGAGTVVEQTNIDSWADTSIQFDVTQGGLSPGTAYVWITTDSGQYNASFPITLTSVGLTSPLLVRTL